jgi:hypothetical protein
MPDSLVIAVRFFRATRECCMCPKRDGKPQAQNIQYYQCGLESRPSFKAPLGGSQAEFAWGKTIAQFLRSGLTQTD